MDAEGAFCPECGADEAGYFCRNCGTLIRGEEMVLCPRCRQVVPHGEFCNQCGQRLGAIALDLHQLALAGDDFWLSDGALELPDETETGLLEPDDSIVLAEAELPDWLKQLPTEPVTAETKPHVYPSLRPIEEEVEQPLPRGRFLPPVFLFLALLLLALVLVVVLLLASGAL